MFKATARLFSCHVLPRVYFSLSHVAQEGRETDQEGCFGSASSQSFPSKATPASPFRLRCSFIDCLELGRGRGALWRAFLTPDDIVLPTCQYFFLAG